MKKTHQGNGIEKSDLEFSISYLERRWLLVSLDLLAINGGFILSLHLRSDYELSWQLLSRNPIWFLLLNGLWFFVGYLFQVYDLEKAGRFDSAFPNSLGAGILSVILFNLIPYLPPSLPPSRQPLFITLFLPLLFLSGSRAIYLLVFAQDIFRRRVVILGAGWAGETIFRALNDHARSIYELVGFIDDDPEKQGKMIRVTHKESGGGLEEPAAIPVIGDSEDLIDIIIHNRVTMVVLSITYDVSGELYQVLTNCLQEGVEVVPMPVLYEQLTGKVPVQHVGEHWSVAMPLEHPGTRVIWHVIKRLFDLFWALLGLIFLCLIFPFVAAAIYLDSPGPIIYGQGRSGRNGKPFWVYKFRTMIPNAEKHGAVWAEENDPRVTRVGRFLRRTHIDEFLQFINILKGEMSVVGPRPERPEFVDELAEEIPFYRVRLAVKPGMAGWGLIHQGYGASKEDALEKLQYDLYYIKHQSLWLDIYILVKTFWDAITFGGR